MTSATTIEVSGVSKWFGPVVALSDVSCSVGPGITALLGPNGAGKSTLLRILCGLTRPSRGDVHVLGQRPGVDLALNRRIGLVPQQESLFDPLSALRFVSLAAELHKVKNPDGAAERALALVDLDPHLGRPVGTYSKGMRQRVKVAQALVHDPEVVFLDEPLEGLDPRQRLRMIELFHRLGGEGRTVIVSSHVLDEVERFGSRVLVIAQGRLAAEGDFRQIRELMDDRPHRLRVLTDKPAALAGALIAREFAVGVSVEDTQTMVVDTRDAPTFRTSLAGAAREVDARLFGVLPVDDDLESVFRYLVSRA